MVRDYGLLEIHFVLGQPVAKIDLEGFALAYITRNNESEIDHSVYEAMLATGLKGDTLTAYYFTPGNESMVITSTPYATEYAFSHYPGVSFQPYRRILLSLLDMAGSCVIGFEAGAMPGGDTIFPYCYSNGSKSTWYRVEDNTEKEFLLRKAFEDSGLLKRSRQ